MSSARSGGLQIDLFEVLAEAPEPRPPEVGASATLPAAAVVAEPLARAAVPAEPDPAGPEPIGKAPGAFRTIGEVAEALGLKPHVLRYWEEQFPQLKPVKRSGSRRYYRPADITLIETIHRLVHAEGYTLKGARQLIAAQAKQARAAKPERGAPQADRLAALRQIRETLALALAQS